MFSKTTEYALRATIFIARSANETRKIGLEEIARSIGSPKSFTAKILQVLCRNNAIVTSIKGPGGGFYITKTARNLPVMRVLEAMGEDGVLHKCVLGLPECSDVNPCPLHGRYKHIKPQLIALFSQKTIGSLADSGDWLLLQAEM